MGMVIVLLIFAINEQKPVTKRPICKGFAKAAEKIEEQAYKEMSVKMNTAYFIAKELQFTKFPGLLQLQQKNGIQKTNTYSNDKKCAKHKIPLCLFLCTEPAFV